MSRLLWLFNRNKIIDKIKKNINYEKIKTFVDRSEYEQCRKVIKDMEIKLEELTPKQYKKSKELIRELLTDNNSFYLIKQDFLRRILDNSKLTGKEIEFKITKQNSIIFEFSKEDILEFSYNKNFIIEKSSIKGNISDKSNTNNGEDFKIPTGISDSIKFNKDLEILVRLFYFNKYWTEKENEAFKELKKEENSEKVYLIHNSWMKEYKSYFDYQFIENYLKNKKEYSNIYQLKQ